MKSYIHFLPNVFNNPTVYQHTTKKNAHHVKIVAILKADSEMSVSTNLSSI